MPGWKRLSQFWKAWPISCVKTPMSWCVPLKLAKMKGTPAVGKQVQKPPPALPGRFFRSRKPPSFISR